MVYSEWFRTSNEQETHENKLEAMKMVLKEPLKDFLKERFNSRREHEKKEAFLVEFNKFWLQEKRAYRDYISELMKNPDLSPDDFNQLSRIDQLEVICCIFNSCYQNVNDDWGDIIINWNNNNVTIYEWGQNQQQPWYETMQNIPIFNVSWTINKKVATMSWLKVKYEHKDFEINESSVSPLENWWYEITLYSGRKIWWAFRGKDEERIELYPTNQRWMAVIKNKEWIRNVAIHWWRINTSIWTTTYNLQLYWDLSAFGSSWYPQHQYISPQQSIRGNTIPPAWQFYPQQWSDLWNSPERPRIIYDPRNHPQKRHHHER